MILINLILIILNLSSDFFFSLKNASLYYNTEFLPELQLTFFS